MAIDFQGFFSWTSERLGLPTTLQSPAAPALEMAFPWTIQGARADYGGEEPLE